MNDFLKINRNGQILEIILDRPKANALDAPASREMGRIFADFRDNPDFRVAILTGAGQKFFSAGWDLKAVAAGEEYFGDFGEGGFGGFAELPGLLKPVICAVNGMAVGAGFEMLLRADFIIAAEHAQFMMPEVRIGVAPDVGTIMLPKLLPRQKALEILMTGRQFNARELATLGLINEVVPADQLMERARALAQDLLRAAPLSLAAIMEALNRTEQLTFEESCAALRSKTWPAFMKMLESSDAREGAKAFVEKRAPEWKG
ncbi:MAG TPA: enoyl-CoA hydratase-related protein [Anaerolineae bacterium]|jgi:crotonobetainyl-CoA hydratase|nr:enoyl-CoA hydratase-related protein [Anaerolineae bacterium]